MNTVRLVFAEVIDFVGIFAEHKSIGMRIFRAYFAIFSGLLLGVQVMEVPVDGIQLFTLKALFLAAAALCALGILIHHMSDNDHWVDILVSYLKCIPLFIVVSFVTIVFTMVLPYLPPLF